MSKFSSLFLSLIVAAMMIALPAAGATVHKAKPDQALVSTVAAPTPAPTIVAAAKVHKVKHAGKSAAKTKTKKAKAGAEKAKPKAKKT